MNRLRTKSPRSSRAPRRSSCAPSGSTRSCHPRRSSWWSTYRTCQRCPWSRRPRSWNRSGWMSSGPWAGTRCRTGPRKPAQRWQARSLQRAGSGQWHGGASSSEVDGEDTGFPTDWSWLGMFSPLRQHAGAGLVAAGVIAASFAQGLFQPLGFGIAAVVVWAAIVAGVIGGLLPTAPPGRLTVWAAVLLAAAAILATVSMAWAHDQGRAVEEALRVWLYLGLFLLAAFTAGGRGRNQWLIGMAIGFGIVSILALAAYLQPGFLTSGHVDIANAQGQLSYPLGYWNAAAALMAVGAVLLAHWSAAAPARAWRTIA